MVISHPRFILIFYHPSNLRTMPLGVYPQCRNKCLLSGKARLNARSGESRQQTSSEMTPWTIRSWVHSMRAMEVPDLKICTQLRILQSRKLMTMSMVARASVVQSLQSVIKLICSRKNKLIFIQKLMKLSSTGRQRTPTSSSTRRRKRLRLIQGSHTFPQVRMPCSRSEMPWHQDRLVETQTNSLRFPKNKKTPTLIQKKTIWQ